jgi:RNA polymerase sigma-70 factor (ECF subfamily)
MATKSILQPKKETELCAGLNQPQPISPEVLRACYTAHYRHVLQICRRFFRQPEDAEDAAAEVFLKLYRVLHQKDETMPFRPWVSQVAGHHCIDKLRQRKRERSSSLEEMDFSSFADDSTPSPLSQLLRQDDQRRIREQLTRLPEKYKTPLVLRYYERMSYSEIARVLNTRLPTVRIMIFRAKSYLRRNLRRSENLNVFSIRKGSTTMMTRG